MTPVVERRINPRGLTHKGRYSAPARIYEAFSFAEDSHGVALERTPLRPGPHDIVRWIPLRPEHRMFFELCKLMVLAGRFGERGRTAFHRHLRSVATRKAAELAEVRP